MSNNYRRLLGMDFISSVALCVHTIYCHSRPLWIWIETGSTRPDSLCVVVMCIKPVRALAHKYTDAHTHKYHYYTNVIVVDCYIESSFCMLFCSCFSQQAKRQIEGDPCVAILFTFPKCWLHINFVRVCSILYMGVCLRCWPWGLVWSWLSVYGFSKFYIGPLCYVLYECLERMSVCVRMWQICYWEGKRQLTDWTYTRYFFNNYDNDKTTAYDHGFFGRFLKVCRWRLFRILIKKILFILCHWTESNRTNYDQYDTKSSN